MSYYVLYQGPQVPLTTFSLVAREIIAFWTDDVRTCLG